MKSSLKLLAFCSLLSTTALSQELSLNMPIIQTKYTADPAPIVYNDTVYLFTSHDEDDGENFHMKDWLLYTSTDMDFTTFKLGTQTGLPDLVLKNKDQVVIDRAIHKLMTDYLRQIHKLKKNVDTGFNDATRKIMIEDDRDEMALQMQKPFQSLLLPLISSLTNCPEFKYRWDDVWTLPIGVFMDSVERVQKHKSYNFVMQGIYSGCVDMKKLDKKELHWMGDLK